MKDPLAPRHSLARGGSLQGGHPVSPHAAHVLAVTFPRQVQFPPPVA